MRLAFEVDVFAEHLDEAKGDVRLYRGESRFDAGAELSPERLLLGGRLRVGQQYLEENEVWGGGRQSGRVSAWVVGEFGGRQADDLLYPRFSRPARTPGGPARAFFPKPSNGSLGNTSSRTVMMTNSIERWIFGVKVCG